uniref:Uncharacterized protein n=1 Tax=Arundo donax TaxID=35708 RepID=A0A0A9EJX0_ARUDO
MRLMPMLVMSPVTPHYQLSFRMSPVKASNRHS